jgi:hypothetical protein
VALGGAVAKPTRMDMSSAIDAVCRVVATWPNATAPSGDSVLRPVVNAAS